jgi:hypothetical protein
MFRRDQRALLFHFTGLLVGPVSPSTTPVPFRKKRVRHERQPQTTEWSVCFRLRHGDGRFAEPQAEAAFKKAG